MSEPKTEARQITQILPNVYRWFVEDDRIGGAESDAHAVVDNGRVVLIDPLPVREQELRRLGEITAIVLTASCHQRASWRYRKLFGAEIYAPEDAVGLEGEPDLRYSGGDALPNNLAALHAPGPTEAMYAIWLSGPRRVVFLADLLSHDGSGVPGFMPSEWQDQPERTRISVRRILDSLPVEALCFNHGPPILHEGERALRAALEHDHEFQELTVT